MQWIGTTFELEPHEVILGAQDNLESCRSEDQGQVMGEEGENGFCQEVLCVHLGHQEREAQESAGDHELEGMSFPLISDGPTSLAAVLDSTGMKAGDQYLAEAKAMHIEGGWDWHTQLDRQIGVCRRAMQRDKGPEVRAKEVPVATIPQSEWDKANKSNEPERVAWSYAWACIWMLTAIEASNMQVRDVLVKFKEKQVKLNIRKSKTDQRGAGAWRTLECCGNHSCSRDCPFELAVTALSVVKSNEGNTLLFPDFQGKPVSKLHMVPACAHHLDKEMSGHSARRSGAMRFARQGLNVHSIQFLGRWRSSAVFRYIEEAMTEVPMNTGTAEQLKKEKCEAKKEKDRKRELRPKPAAAPRKRATIAEEPHSKIKALVSEVQTSEVFAMLKTRGNVTRQFCPTKCQTRTHPKSQQGSEPCKKCFRLKEERDSVKGAREWAHAMREMCLSKGAGKREGKESARRNCSTAATEQT